MSTTEERTGEPLVLGLGQPVCWEGECSYSIDSLTCSLQYSFSIRWNHPEAQLSLPLARCSSYADFSMRTMQQLQALLQAANYTGLEVQVPQV